MRRSGILLCYPFEEKRLRKWPAPYILQPKLDGDRCRALCDGYGSVTLLSSEQNVIHHVPHINMALSDCIQQPLELDGELYTHGMSHELIHGIASRRVNPHAELENLEYHVFDVVSEEPQIQRTLFLHKLAKQFPKDGPIKLVPFWPVSNLDEIMQHYDRVVEAGYEGIILRDHTASYIRRRSTQVMKFKPKKKDWYVAVGVEEEVSKYGEPKGTLGAIICISDSKQETFNVGTGFSAEQRRELWNRRHEIPGRVIEVAYQHTTEGRGVPRFPVFVSVVWDLTQVQNVE